jgi:hypothetical protein
MMTDTLTVTQPTRTERMICQVSYEEGRAAFAAGMTLRAAAERMMVSAPADEDKAMSFMLGFADELLLLLRRPLVAVNASVNFPLDETGQRVR